MNRRALIRILTNASAGLAGVTALGRCGDSDSGPPGDIPPCQPNGQLPDALLNCRNWITFQPPSPFNPGVVPASEAELEGSLDRLAEEGWRGLVTYSLDPSQGLDQTARIARQAGFTSVIAGLFVHDEPQFIRERAAALVQVQYVDGFVLGNEVLQRGVGGFAAQRLATEIADLRSATGRPVATSETYNRYLADPTLASLGDWLFPNLQFWFDPAIRTPAQAAQVVETQYLALQAMASGRAVVVKEAWWPTAGDPAATEENQVEFFRALAASPVRFVWGEAYDQFWKQEPLGQGPNWGLHRSDGGPKPVVPALRSTYRGG